MYMYVRELGNGTFGRVLLVYNTRLQRHEAVKCLKQDSPLPAQEEITFHGCLPPHKNVVEFYGVFVDREHLFLSMEYAPQGDLFNAISGKLLLEKTAAFYFRQVLEAVGHCHANGVAHRDVKLENLLLDGDTVKLCDFGYACPIDSKVKRVVGTPVYLAPEVILKDPEASLEKADVWACGVVLYCMLVGKYPFAGESDYLQVCKNIVSLNFSVPTNLTPEARCILQRMLEPDYKKRPSVADLKDHPWLDGWIGSPDSPVSS